jgi:hypothetical protein
MIFLFWFFSDMQTHIDIYNYFVGHFGKGRRGQPRFPIMVLFMVIPLIFFPLIYLIVAKLICGTFNEPKFENNPKDKNSIKMEIIRKQIYDSRRLFEINSEIVDWDLEPRHGMQKWRGHDKYGFIELTIYELQYYKQHINCEFSLNCTSM